MKTGTNYNGGIQQSTRGKRSGEVADEIWVPDRYVGLCIGAQGKDILRIEADTRTKITVWLVFQIADAASFKVVCVISSVRKFHDGWSYLSDVFIAMAMAIPIMTRP